MGRAAAHSLHVTRAKVCLCCCTSKPNSNGVWLYSVAKLVHLSQRFGAVPAAGVSGRSFVTAAEPPPLCPSSIVTTSCIYNKCSRSA